MTRYPLHHSWFWERAPFFRILLPLIAGIVFYESGPGKALTTASVLIIAVILGLAYVVVSVARQKPATINYLSFFILQAFFVAIGLLVSGHHDIRQNKHWFGRSIDTNAKAYLVKAAEPFQEKDKTWRMRVQVIKAINSGDVEAVAGEAFVSIYKNGTVPEYSEGDSLIVYANWLPITNSGNPFEYDYAKACARKGIYHQCFIGAERATLYGKCAQSSVSATDRLHNWSNKQLTRYVKDTATLSLLQAMILGDERNLDADTRQTYSDTGVIHIVSISGSHVAMLFLVITWMLFWLRGRYADWIKYAAGIIVVWIYVLMAGAPPSAIRSALMFSFLAAGIVFSKERQPLNILFASAFLLLLMEPQWLFTIGFQLSFTAVLSLTLFYEPIFKIWSPKNYIAHQVWKAVCASVAVEILTAPLVVYYFHNLPLFVIVANIIAGILIGICALVGGFAILVFSGLPLVANTLARVLMHIVHGFNTSMIFLQKLTFPSWKYLYVSFAELVLIYLIITAAAVALIRRKRIGYMISVSILSVLLCLFTLDKWRAIHQAKVVVYNTGKQPHIEQIAGTSYSSLVPEADKEENYITKAAHTGWHAYDKSAEQTGNPFLFKGKRILVLNEAPDNLSNSFPVDVLLIPISVKKMSPTSLRHIFNPKKIVLCGPQSRYYKSLFADSCKQINMQLHDVATDGALVME